MKMFFAENDKVIIMDSNKEYRETNRQNIADYCIKELRKQSVKDLVGETTSLVVMPEYLPKLYNPVTEEEKKDIIIEAIMLLVYLAFIERITLLPENIVLIKILARPTDIKLQVSDELYKFLIELQ